MVLGRASPASAHLAAAFQLDSITPSVGVSMNKFE